MSSPKMLKKITVKTVFGTLQKKAIPDSGETLEQINVYGQVRRMVPGQTDLGPFIRFKGTFEAVNIGTGEMFRSMNMILPDEAADLLEEALSSEGAKSVDFALKIGVAGDDSNIGYHYYVEPLMQSQEGDPLEAIRNNLQGQGLLAAPDPAPETEQKPAPASRSRKKSAAA